MHSIFVADFMNHQPHVVNASTNIRQAVELLLREKVIGVPVVDDDNTLVGYLSEQDCIEELLNDVFHCEEPGSVSRVMQKNVLSVTPAHS